MPYVLTAPESIEQNQQRLHMPLLSLLWQISCRCEAKYLLQFGSRHKARNEMCPIKGMENKYAYLAERCTSHLSSNCTLPPPRALCLSPPFSFSPPLLSPFFLYGGNCSFSSHHWLKENFNTPLAQQELHMI